MQHVRATLVLVTFLFLPLLAPLPAGGQATIGPLLISELQPAPGDGEREFVELWNDGNETIQLEGYQVEDLAGNAFTFPPWELAPGKRVVVWGGGEATAEGPAWTRATVWNNGGDSVLLLDAAGTLRDQFDYGDQGGPAVPAAGVALLLSDTGWTTGPPTPGTHPDAEGGAAQASVENVAPHVATFEVPGRARPASEVALRFVLADDNGDADIASWTLRDATGVLAQGALGGEHRVSATAPSSDGPWELILEVSDQAGATTTAASTVQVRGKDLFLELPQHQSVRFPPLRPGASHVTSLDNLTIHNDGIDPLRPLLDVSPFRNTAGDQLPVDGNLRVGARLVSGATVQWLDYEGPLLRLPQVPPGDALEVVLQIVKVPTPLPAGDYGTSFTVVPA